jgi:hypothetical protein
MSHRPATAKTLKEVVGDRKRAFALRTEAKGSPARCSSPMSPLIAPLPLMPAYMSSPMLLEEEREKVPHGSLRATLRGAHPDPARASCGEDSDVSDTQAPSVLSGRSTVTMSVGSTPTASCMHSPRSWWGHEAASETDSHRDDDTVSVTSSVSSVSTCSERGPSMLSMPIRPRMARPHTAIGRHSTGSLPSSLDRAQRDLAFLTLGQSGGESSVVEHTRMPAEFEAIFSKARHGRYKDVNELLQAGAPADGVDARGNTPLHAACQGGSLKTVKVLLRHGCETNAQNDQGNTPLHYALAYRYNEVAEYLMRKGGALPEICNMYGLSAREGLGTKMALESSDGGAGLHASGRA